MILHQVAITKLDLSFMGENVFLLLFLYKKYVFLFRNEKSYIYIYIYVCMHVINYNQYDDISCNHGNLQKNTKINFTQRS